MRRQWRESPRRLLRVGSAIRRGICIGYDYQSVKIVEEGVIRDKGGKLTLVKRTTSTEHVPGDVGAQKLWLINRCPTEWRDKVDVSHQIEPEQTSEELRADLLQFLLDNMKLVSPDAMALIDGKVEVTNGVARIGAKTRRPNG